jgi:hypothetical protein
MEYSLEGYGYSWSRVLRGQPAYRGLSPARQRAFDAQIDQLSLMRSSTGYWPERIEAPPDLLASLHVRAPSSPRAALALDVATSAREVLDELAGAMELRVTHCTFEETATPEGGADLVLGVYSPTLTKEIARDDSVAAGVIIALYGDGGPGPGALEVIPRIFRKVCENGAMVHLLDEAPLQIVVHPPERRARLREEIERRVTAALGVEVLMRTAVLFQAAAADPLDHRGGRHAAELRNALPYDQWRAVMDRYAADVWTRWGLANALTAEARWARTFVDARRLERMGAAVATARVQHEWFETARALVAAQEAALEAPAPRPKKISAS